MEETETTEDWTREKVSFDAAYGGERVIAYLYLPKNAAPPFQTVVYFPGSDAIFEDKFTDGESIVRDFVPKSGRALIVPIYKSTFERRDGLKSDYRRADRLLSRPHDRVVEGPRPIHRLPGDAKGHRPHEDSLLRVQLGEPG